MRILVMMTRRHDAILQIKRTLESGGYEVRIIYVDHYQSCHSYFAKKIDEWGFHAGKMKYDRGIYDQAKDAVLNWQAKRILFVNFAFAPEWKSEFKALCQKNNCLMVSWLVDPADVDNPDIPEVYGFYDKAYFYEEYAAKAIREKYNFPAQFCPVGFNPGYDVKPLTKPSIDIAFLGSPYKNRMAILDKLAQIADQEHWKLDVFGPFLGESRYFWKKYQRKMRYQNLFKHVHDGCFASDEIAKIYADAKICLNMHLDEQVGMNPRCYEVMATGSFLLTDIRQDYGKFVPGEDFGVYTDFDDLVQKIKYYLENEESRKQIAANGRRKVQSYSMKRCLQEMLEIQM